MVPEAAAADGSHEGVANYPQLSSDVGEPFACVAPSKTKTLPLDPLVQLLS